MTDSMRWGYRACDGAAHQRYDLDGETMQFTSLAFNVPDAPPEADGTNDPQACFDRLVRRYAANNRTTLTPEELKQFGKVFASECAVAP
jgi:hypothetical protein